MPTSARLHINHTRGDVGIAPYKYFVGIIHTDGRTLCAPTNKAHQLSLVSFAYILLYILEQCYDIFFAAHSYCLIYYLSVL